jgi:hypothetical protein
MTTMTTMGTCGICGASTPGRLCTICAGVVDASQKLAEQDDGATGDVEDALTVLVHHAKSTPRPAGEHTCARETHDGRHMLDMNCQACRHDLRMGLRLEFAVSCLKELGPTIAAMYMRTKNQEA